MRMLVDIQMPLEPFNARVKDGTAGQILQSILTELKPEAAYFYPEDGKRTALMVFDMKGSWQFPAMVEPLFQNLGASVQVTPVMNGEDLQRGFKEAGM